MIHRKAEITQISPSELKKKVLLLDIDNTLALQDDEAPYEGTLQWAQKMKETGHSLIVVSNNGEERVRRFAAQYSLPYVANAHKPLSSGFNRARKLLGAKKRDCVVIGDQFFTDYLGARFAGMSVILLEPIETEKRGFLRFKRVIDRFIRKNFLRRKYHD